MRHPHICHLSSLSFHNLYLLSISVYLPIFVYISTIYLCISFYLCIFHIFLPMYLSSYLLSVSSNWHFYHLYLSISYLYLSIYLSILSSISFYFSICLSKHTGVGSLSLLQGIFPTQGLNPGLLHCRQILYQLNHKQSPRILEWVAYPFSRRSSQPRD